MLKNCLVNIPEKFPIVIEFEPILDSAKSKDQRPLSPVIDSELGQQQWQSQFADLENLWGIYREGTGQLKDDG